MDRSPRASETDRPVAAGPPGAREGDELAHLLGEYGKRVGRRERDRALARMDEPTSAQRNAVDALAVALVGGILDAPTETLERPDCPSALATTARELFCLERTEPDP